MTASPPWLRHPQGITTVDARYVRPGFASVHFVERDGRVAIIDSGANSSVPHVEQALQALGLAPASVELVFLTHVHLDHAGGAGRLLQRLPNARVLVHPRGASHLSDPARLESAARSVYGESVYDQLYGRLVPISADRVHTTHDGQRVALGSSELVVLHTPGHALHHQVLFDVDASAVFCGDSFGLSYRELDTAAGPFIMPTTSPTQFDPEQLQSSIERIAALAPAAVYLTHFGRVSGVPALAKTLLDQLEHFVELAREHAHEDDRLQSIRRALRELIVDRIRAHGVVAPEARVDTVLGEDLELNAQGLVVWLERSERARGT